MVQRYTMRAFKTTSPTKHVYWTSIGSADMVGTYSNYPPADLSSIAVDYITDVDFVPSQLPPPDATSAGGDLSGTYPSPTVIRINGATVPAAGAHICFQYLDRLSYGLLTNSNVSASAAIAGTKISPNFGSQNITTTGILTSGSIVIGSSGPTLTKGSGAPGSASVNGSIYLRTDGTAYTGIYTYQSGAWVTLKTDAISFSGSDVVKATSSSAVTLSHTTTTESTSSYGEFITALRDLSTSNATQADLYTWTITDEATTAVDVIVTAIKSDGTLGAVYKRSAGFRRDGGTVSTIFAVSDDRTEEDDSDWNVTIDNNSSTGRVRVTGEASTTIRWVATVRLQTTTTS